MTFQQPGNPAAFSQAILICFKHLTLKMSKFHNISCGAGFKATALTGTKEFSLLPCELSKIFKTVFFQNTSEWILADLYLLKVNLGNTRAQFEICSKLTKEDTRIIISEKAAVFERKIFFEYKSVSKYKNSSEYKKVSKYKKTSE